MQMICVYWEASVSSLCSQTDLRALDRPSARLPITAIDFPIILDSFILYIAHELPLFMFLGSFVPSLPPIPACVPRRAPYQRQTMSQCSFNIASAGRCRREWTHIATALFQSVVFFRLITCTHTINLYSCLKLVLVINASSSVGSYVRKCGSVRIAC